MLSNHQTNQHTPVLLREVLQYLAPEKGNKLLDATAGYGGHATAILEVTGQREGTVLIDRDRNAVTQLHKIFPNKSPEILHGDFLSISQDLQKKGRRFDLILADLGVSSPHLDNASRGFSFQVKGPLDMRMDDTSPLTAEKIINTYDEVELQSILTNFGEEPKARRISQTIISNRPIKTTTDLANLIVRVYGGRGKYKTHPATKTFQALRIAVNDELSQIQKAIPAWISLLNSGGRVGIISFHSLEDRIVKKVLQEYGGNRYDAEIMLSNRKPIISTHEEIVLNPRARSAKLRVAVKK